MDFPIYKREKGILDVFLTNNPSYEYTCQPLPGIKFLKSAVDIKPNKATARKIYLWYKADFESIRNISADPANNFLNGSDINTPIDTLWNGFKKICTTYVWNKFHLE